MANNCLQTWDLRAGERKRAERLSFNLIVLSSMVGINKLWTQEEKVPEERTSCSWQKWPAMASGNAILIRWKPEWEPREDLLLGALGRWERERAPFVYFAKAHRLPPRRRLTLESLVSKRVTSAVCVAEWEGPVLPWSCQLGPGLEPSRQWPWFLNGSGVSRSFCGSWLGVNRKSKGGGRKR